MNNFTTWLTAIMLAIFTTMVAIATTYPPGARFMPFIVGLPAIALCLLQLLQDWLAAHKTKLAGHFHSAPRAGEHSLAEYPTAEHVVEPVEEPEYGPHTVRSELTIWAYFLSYMVAVLLFGFILSVPVMVTVYLWREAKVRLPYAALAGIICVTLLSLMFQTALHFQLHPGFLTPVVLKAFGY